MSNVSYFGQRKTGGSASNDTPMREGSKPADDFEDFDEIAYVCEKGNVIPKELHDERRRKKEEVERAARERI